MNRSLRKFIAALVAAGAAVAVGRALLARGAAIAFRNSVGSLDGQAKRDLLEALENGYASTLGAFATAADREAYEARDAQAKRDAETLRTRFTSVRTFLAPEFEEACEAFVERVTAAQLQLMAFAINRKHHGLPDAAQTEAEIADRANFKKEAAPLFEQLTSALG